MIQITRSPWDFRAVSAAEKVITTFQFADQAARWVEDEAPNFPGCRVERVRITTTVETVHQQPVERERAA